MAIRGDDPLKIKQRAGHAAFTTTEGYVRQAEAVRSGFGVYQHFADPARREGGIRRRRPLAPGRAGRRSNLPRSSRSSALAELLRRGRDSNPRPLSYPRGLTSIRAEQSFRELT